MREYYDCLNTDRRLGLRAWLERLECVRNDEAVPPGAWAEVVIEGEMPGPLGDPVRVSMRFDPHALLEAICDWDASN